MKWLPPPEAADAPPDAVDVAQLAVAAQLRDELPGLGAARGIGDGQGLVVRVAEVAPRGDGRADKGGQGVPVDVAQGAKGLHEDAATDVDTHDVGDDFLAQVARETDDATRPGMDVGHDAHPASPQTPGWPSVRATGRGLRVRRGR